MWWKHQMTKSLFYNLLTSTPSLKKMSCKWPQTQFDAFVQCSQRVFSRGFRKSQDLPQTFISCLIRTYSIFRDRDGKVRTICSPRRIVLSTIRFRKIQKCSVQSVKVSNLAFNHTFYWSLRRCRCSTTNGRSSEASYFCETFLFTFL